MVKREWVSRGDPWPPAISDGLVLPCQRCGEAPKFDYRVTEEKWAELVPAEERRGVVCLPCLDRIAAAKGIDFAGTLIEVQFTGTGQTIVLTPTRIVDYEPRQMAKEE